MAPNPAEAKKKVHRIGKYPDGDNCPTKPPVRINHTHAGVWDFFEEVEDDDPRFSFAPLWARYAAIPECVPYAIRMANDLLNIPGFAWRMVAYAATELLRGLVPVISIWLQGQLLSVTQAAVDTRRINQRHFILVCGGLLLCNLANTVLVRVRKRMQVPLNARIRRWYSLHSFGARARLDLPTYGEVTTQRLLSDASGNLWGETVPWQAVQLATSIVSAMMQLFTSVVVLLRVLRDQQGGQVLVALTFFSEISSWMPQFTGDLRQRVWISTTYNEDYIKMRRWQKTVEGVMYRKELVAGGLAGYAMSEFKRAAERVGDRDAHWHEVEEQVMHRPSRWIVLAESLRELPQMYFAFLSAQQASSSGVPASFASLNLIQNATHRLGYTVYEIVQRTKSVSNHLESIRKLYESINIRNVIPDGTVPFPEETAELKLGIELEFRNVSFKYPDTDQWALRNISFKLLAGQLCVIVGANGAGKSTILKLTTRLYDPQEGEILVGGRDIRTLKLSDIRRCMSVLFQDYTLFPLSIRDNIALGDRTATSGLQSSESSEDHVEQVARLVGAQSFIDKLPNGLDTYLERPVPIAYSGAIEGTKSLSGRTVSYEPLREAAGVHKAAGLSGGQIQRLAVARTLFGSVKDEGTVGLLLFDEPSASLDPDAEHDLFNQLRELRGSKTMLFSSHRFGHLTGYADLILYMDGTGIVESGTHHELMARKGEYARLWSLQARAFS